MNILKEFNSEEFQSNLKTLENTFGRNKIIPENIKLPALVALSYFPELKNTKIRFKIQSSNLALASRPNWKTIFLPKDQWEYLIVISDKSRKVPDELLFTYLPLNAQIGILGHELSHTIYYLDKNSFEIISLAFKYLNSKYRIKFENKTDGETIKRGLGWALLEFAKFCRSHSQTKEKLKKWLDKYYLSPSRIMKEMENISEYKIIYGKDQQEKTDI